MSNYHTTIAYIFEKEPVVRELFSKIIENKESEKLLDLSKVKSPPAGISKEDFPKWMNENWGGPYYTEFQYSIYEDFSKIQLEGRWATFPELFENLAREFSVPVLTIYYTESI